MRFMPSGGIGPSNAVEYLDHPAVLAVGGSWTAPRAAIAAVVFSLVAKLAAEAGRLVHFPGRGGGGELNDHRPPA